MKRLVALLETVGGSRPLPPQWRARPASGFVLGIWWAVLLVLTLAFVGRATKFIYVDF